MSEHFCLKWNNHQTTLVSVFDKLLECESLVDCTLAADGRYMKAHKVVLSACSSYLEEILRNHEDKHPILIFNDISYSELKAMLEYMYRGEVNVSQEQLNTFLKAAEALKIKGLTDQGGGGGTSDGGGQDNLKRKMGAAQSRKTQSPVLGMTPVERPTSPKRRKPARRQSRDENFPGDSNSCDTAPTPPPSQPQQVNSIAARIEEKVAKIKKESGSTPSGAEPPGGASALSALGMLQPKTEFLEESGNVEDLTLEEEEEYGPNPGTSQGSFSSQDFNNWQLGDPTSDEVFMASQHDLNNSAGNSQVDSRDLADEDSKVKFESLGAIDHTEQMKVETHITDRTVQTVDEEEDPAMHTMMITPELLGLIPSSQSDCSDVCSTSTVKSNYSTICTGLNGTNKSWTQEDMDQALQALRHQTMSLSKASATYGIPSTTLWQRAHRLGIDTPKKEGQTKSWTEHSLNTALEALRTGQISANKASKAYGIPSSTLYKIARREGIRLAAPFNAAPTAWVPEDLERALDAIRSGQCTVQRAAAEYGIPSGTLYGRCKREGIELSRNNPTPWSEEAMMDALEAVRIGQMSINQAAIHFNLPYSSLYGRFKRGKYESISGNQDVTATPQQQPQQQQPQTTAQQPPPPPPSATASQEIEQNDLANQQQQPQPQPPQQHSPTNTAQQQPQIMLVQYQQPLHVYQPATAT